MKRAIIASLGIVVAAFLCVFAGRMERSWAKDDPPQLQLPLVSHLKDWRYPESRLGSSSFGSGGGTNGRVRTETSSSNAVMYTNDDVKTVVAYYLKKGNFPRPDDDPKSKHHRGFADANKDGVGGGGWIVMDDSSDRPVTVRVMVKHTADSSLLLIISRAEGEKETHIVWNMRESRTESPRD